MYRAELKWVRGVLSDLRARQFTWSLTQTLKAMRRQA
jgi:hypothetical protein